ncbi:MAG: DUF6629 family protein [Patescibacteria group bacterium]
MCFSVAASFVVSGSLGVAGVASLGLAKKSERMMALVPILFGIQQAIEGLQWLAPHPSLDSQVLGYAYLFFAFLLWPTYIPAAAYALETNQKHKKLLSWMFRLGLFVSTGLLVTLIMYKPVISLSAGHFVYAVPVSPLALVLGTIVYSIAVVGSLLISSRRSLQFFGIFILAAEITAATIFPSGFVSVWCFFAAVSSALVYLCFYLWSKRSRLSSW